MKDNFNINRRKFISTGAALSLGIPLLGKVKANGIPDRKLQPELSRNGATNRQVWPIAGWEIPA
jgi:hypothetical protein